MQHGFGDRLLALKVNAPGVENDGTLAHRVRLSHAMRKIKEPWHLRLPGRARPAAAGTCAADGIYCREEPAAGVVLAAVVA
jgi:hypothetical protein